MYFINSLMQGVELTKAQPRGESIWQGPSFQKEEEKEKRPLFLCNRQIGAVAETRMD